MSQVNLRRVWVVLLLLIAAAFGGCNFRQVDPNESARRTEVRATELEMNVQRTLVAQLATEQAPNSARQTQQALDLVGTLNADASPTPDAAGPTLPTDTLPAETPSAQTPPASESPATPVVLDDAALRERMQTASILVYEDMVARTDTNRYVKDTLNRMGLPFKDDGNAQGWLTNDLEAGAPNGQPWDLVIVAMEEKSNPRGDFLPLVLQTLDNTPASVILETWFLNDTYSGTGADLLARCGVAYQSDRRGISPAIMIMFSLLPDHPLLNQPNTGISLTDTTNYWWDTTGRNVYDTGDTLQLVPGGSAQLVAGTKGDQKTSFGALLSCMDGRLIWQTFSSHTFNFDSATLLWENYIFNALRTRFSTGSN